MSDFTSLIGLTSAGKSGSFFYYSDDGKYLIKTISIGESKFLKSFIPNYYQHMSGNYNSLIVKVFGFHKIIEYKNNAS